MSSTQRKIILGLLFLSILVFGGTAGYMIIEGASFLDALFMTVITLTTIGYSEHVPLSKTGMVFTMILAISGVGFFFYIFSIIGDIIATSTLEIFSGKRMEGQIAKLKDHCILCGFGRVGKHVYEFLSPELSVVVIEKDPEKIEELQGKNILHIQGDATLEENLLKAGIERAKYLVATLGEDALNLYVVITSRGLNPDIYIVSRANEHGVEKKLYQVGANIRHRAILPILASGFFSPFLMRYADANFSPSLSYAIGLGTLLYMGFLLYLVLSFLLLELYSLFVRLMHSIFGINPLQRPSKKLSVVIVSLLALSLSAYSHYETLKLEVYYFHIKTDKVSYKDHAYLRCAFGTRYGNGQGKTHKRGV
jgi:voltage-gated potassium channel Kch